MQAKLKKGDRVKHATRPEWGVGEVLADQSADRVRIMFEVEGLKELDPTRASFTNVTGDEAQSVRLTERVAHQLAPVKGTALKARKPPTILSLEKASENFLKYFPKGFNDPDYLSGRRSERDYKDSAVTLLHERLEKKVLTELLEAHAFNEICDRAKAVINKTNLIHQQEKIALGNGLSRDGGQQVFAEALNDLLNGLESEQHRFERFSKMLDKVGAAKWPIATYFLFIGFPKTHAFLKPEATKFAADMLRIDINYRPELNWLTYRCVQTLFETLKARLIKDGRAELVPRDMIDVQSFIWVTAPTYAES
ncbi:DUF3553 domain-containing protein [Caballeronia concitans]|uniref:DUF3553 domain-containing protein n=1 Tax=Caballeronia concitans TaxID=1777133 RepID=A0A658R5T1_9BURK|nr:DUF3553 domain-containing protein [Caballeronia concitans]SAL51416.1 hypothetical protein AWB72_05443 [Caballeronia concitans]